MSDKQARCSDAFPIPVDRVPARFGSATEAEVTGLQEVPNQSHEGMNL